MSSHVKRTFRTRPRILGVVAGAALLIGGGGFAAQALADSGPRPAPARPKASAPDAAPAAPAPAAPKPAAPATPAAPKPASKPVPKPVSIPRGWHAHDCGG
ncbi:hypothetical protein [Streptomyces sp. NPDC039028]|uniref:hypothetical protein n=1 Tax=Streptomyces sp. NPDC039028 TaxID=3155370 RepID=UPI0033D1ED40